MTRVTLLPFVAVVLCAACHGDQAPAPVPNPKTAARAPAVKHGPSPAELTAGMVEAPTIGKSTVPVAVKFDLSRPPTVGQPLEVAIAVMPQEAADSAVVEATGSGGLELGPDLRPLAIPSVEASQVYRFIIPVVPSAEGVQLLGLVVSLRRAEAIESRSFSVPLIVAAGVPAAGAPAAGAPDGGAQRAASGKR